MALLEKARITKDLRVGIGAFLLAKGGHNIDKTPVVLHPPLGSASLLLLLLLFGHLGKRRANQTLVDLFHAFPQAHLVRKATGKQKSKGHH